MNFPGLLSRATITAIFLLTAGCATLPEGFERLETHAYVDTEDTRLGHAFRDEAAAHPGKSGFHPLANGLDAFVARAVLARAAQCGIDAQYYLLHDDLTGELFIRELLDAANRGVRVRLLVDDMDLAGRDLGAAVLDSHPNMEVRLFNPFSRKTFRTLQLLTGSRSVRRRMHNKSFTVDNQVTIVGGRNIGNEYFEANPDLAYSDLDVLAVGPVVRKVSESFDSYWNSELAYPATVLRGEPPTAKQVGKVRGRFAEVLTGEEATAFLSAAKESALAQKIRRGEVDYHWGKAEVLYDLPEKIIKGDEQTEYHLSPQLRPYFEELDHEVIIFSAYFAPGRKGTALLKQLADRGVTVRILTNSLAATDVTIVYAGYAKYRKDLMRSGVELYELKKDAGAGQHEDIDSARASLHAKSFIFDREKVFIGSLNLDPRAMVHNTEIGIMFETEPLAEEMANWFDSNIEQLAFRLQLKTDEKGNDKILWHEKANGKTHTYDIDPHTSFWRRFSIDFLSLLPIESQL